MTHGAPDVTQKLLAWRGGQQEALNELLPLVYGELRRLARHRLQRGGEQTLESRALVHEVYLRLVDQDSVQWRDRAHFFGLASNLMRNILVDRYRTRHAVQRGGSALVVPLDEAAMEASTHWDENVLAIDAALTRLATLDPQQAPGFSANYAEFRRQLNETVNRCVSLTLAPN